ncbi:MAG TPA: hypothetical protein VFA45_08760 [Actinomycetes bacterium]|jgi:hypothetical protein|nr:hypothetical protein [Actinomycetes bacterium]
MPSTENRRARLAATLVFFSPGELAVAVLGIEGGALVGLPAGAAVVGRLGSRAGLRLGFAIYPTALVGVALAPGLGWLATGLAVMAAANSVVDVAMNVQGVELERRYGRPVLSGLHAAHPIGMLAGGLTGVAAAAAGLAIVSHFALAAGTGLIGGLAATRWLVTERPSRRRSPLARPSGRLALLGAAPALGRMSPPVAVATVTTLGYLGSFTGPPVIGALAELVGLSRALG